MIGTQALIDKFKYALDSGFGYIWGAAGSVWTQAKQDISTDSNIKKYGQQWVGHRVADCSGLFSWAFKQFGSYMYHGSNTMWRDYCTAKGDLKTGKRTDGQELKPGTAVFTDHDGDKTHVGLYIGNGTVIEAASTRYGVITSKVTNSKWKCWGELKGVDYGMVVPVTDSKAYPTLKKGMKGSNVTMLQTMLMAHGYQLPKWGADGDFGNETLKAVKAFQKDRGLTADGIVGPATWAALNETDARRYTVTIDNMTLDQANKLLKEYPTADVKEVK